MCLAVPMRVIEAEGNRGIVETSGVCHEIRFDLVGDVQVGEFVLVHAGYAIQVMDEDAAAEQFALLESVLSADQDGAATTDSRSAPDPRSQPGV